MMDADHAREDVFVALADPTRRLVLERLANDGPAPITRLAADLPISRQAVTKHLRVLEAAGLVTHQKAGREQRYTLARGPLGDAAAWLDALGARWDDRLAALRRLVEDDRQED